MRGSVALKAARGLLLLVLVGSALLTTYEVAGTVNTMVRGRPFFSYAVGVVWDATPLVTPEATIASVQVQGPIVPIEGAVAVAFGRGFHPWLMWYLVGALLTGAATVAGAWLLLRLLGNASRGEALTDRNTRRVRWLGILATAMPVLAAVYRVTEPNDVVAGGSAVPGAATFSISLPALAVGLAILALSEVWAHAAATEADQRLTV